MIPVVKLTSAAQSNTPIYDQTTRLSYIIDVDTASNKISALIAGYTPEAEATSVDITIPEKISAAEYEVTGIAPNCFSSSAYRDLITDIKFPKTIKTIGDNAFKDCKNIAKMDLSTTSLTTVGSSAFSGCTGLEELKLPDSVTEINYSAFYGCSKLAKFDFPKKLTYIGQSAFTNCTSLPKAELSDTIKAIGSSAFSGCTALVAVTLPKDLVSIDEYTFYNCASLTKIAIPNSVKTIGTCAFSGCVRLNAIDIPTSVQSIGSLAFAGCTTLSAVIIPYTLENIASNAFINSAAEIWGYTGSFAQTFAQQIATYVLPFHPQGSVQKVTFSADIQFATVSNIVITSSNGVLVIPPAIVTSGDILSISVTAPDGYEINYITINNSPFANGSAYSVADRDVNIFVSYKLKEAITTTTTAAVSNVVTTSTTTETSTAPVSVIPADDDDPDEEINNSSGSNDADSIITVDSDLEDINGVNVRVISQKSNFIGPATVRITNTAEAYMAAKDAIEELDIDDGIYYAFDISIYDQSGKENPGIMAKGTATIQMPVPNELIPYADTIRVYHIVDESPVLLKSSIIEDINGVMRVQFETNSFSPYMLIASTDDDGTPVIDDEDTTRPANGGYNDDDENEEKTAEAREMPRTAMTKMKAPAP